MLSAETIADESRLLSHAAEWTELADACGSPYSQPGWALAWWRHARPAGAELRVVVVRDGERVVAVAPFYAEGGSYKLLASSLAEPIELLAAPGGEHETAMAIATELATLEPRPRAIDFGTQPSASRCVWHLREGWPGGSPPSVREGATVPMHVLSIEGLDFEGWLGSRDAKQRSNMRRYRRKLEEAGATIRLTAADTLADDVDALLRLHVARRKGDETPLADDGIAPMLAEAGGELIPGGRFRLICVDLDGKTIGARLMLAAGGMVTDWNAGFDDAYAKLSPSLATFSEGVALAVERGDRAIDMGPDTAEYKRRLTDEERALVYRVLLPKGRGYLRMRARLALRMGV